MTDISPIMIGSPDTGLYKRQLRPLSIFDRSLIVPAIGASFRKLDPRTLVKNPVMFCVEIVSVLTTIFFLRDLIVGGGTVVGTNALFSGQITIWLWFTVLFANFAEAVAEGRGKAQADALRRTRTETKAKRLQAANSRNFELVDATALKPGDLVLVETNDLIPSDGEVIEGVASVDEFGYHRRIRAGHSRERRRPLGGNGRHAGHVGLAEGTDHGRPRIDLSRPHDRARRRRGAAENPERDRAQYPARRHDADLRLCHCQHSELCVLRRGCGVGRRPDRAVRDPDPDDDRSVVVGDRHRGHGPAGALQRARDVRPCGRGCR